MELVTQEPTIQSCFRVITSTCLAKGILIEASPNICSPLSISLSPSHLLCIAPSPGWEFGDRCMQVRGQKPTPAFQRHINRYYTDFCEQAIRSMFACGFVPWRLRRLLSGDIVPEVLPLGTFSWGIREGNESYRKTQEDLHRKYGRHSAEPSFYNNKRGKRTLQPRHGRPEGAPQPASRGNGSKFETQGEIGVLTPPRAGKKGAADSGQKLPSSVQDAKQKEVPFLFRKHQMALAADKGPGDTKTLHYEIRLLCSSSLRVEVRVASPNFFVCTGLTSKVQDVEIYEFTQPNYHVTAASSIMSTVSSPMAHLVVDYRTLRRAQLQREYADLWNCRAKMVCSYQSNPNRYSLNEGNAILPGSDWSTVPQNRGAAMSDAAIPTDPEYNVQVRDHIMEASFPTPFASQLVSRACDATALSHSPSCRPSKTCTAQWCTHCQRIQGLRPCPSWTLSRTCPASKPSLQRMRPRSWACPSKSLVADTTSRKGRRSPSKTPGSLPPT